MAFTRVVALLALFGGPGYSSAVGMGKVVLADGASFLSALEWRFVGPLCGGRVLAVAGHPDDPEMCYNPHRLHSSLVGCNG